MADENRNVIVTQKPGEAFAVAGSDCAPPIDHRFEGGVTHRTDKPVVHMHLWNEACVGKVDAQVVVRGDAAAPVALQHRFPDEHRQTHRMETGLGEPIHHALQMRTPLRVTFCNSWQVASDYSVGLTLGGRKWLDVRITGATVATPQPCADDCPPPVAGRTGPASGPASDVTG